MTKRFLKGFYVDLTMLFVLGILIGLLSGVQSEALDVTQCNSYVKRKDGVVCYTTVAFTDPWDVAQKLCQSRNQTLVEILTKEENDAVQALLMSNNIVDSWLGAVQSNETWRWLDGVEVSDQGCYVDKLDDPDIAFVTNFPNNTIETCMKYCDSLSYHYASVEAGQMCRCGMTFGRYGQQEAACGSVCPGNNSQNCGGDSSQQIYSVYDFLKTGINSNWLRGQPSNTDEYQTCATIDSETGYQWQDVYCRDSYKALCEIRPVRNSCAQANRQSFAINGRCILPTDKETNFFQSRYTCSTYGGDLLTYLTAEDTALLAQALQNPSNTSVQYYIGLTKWAWKWQTENEFLYTNWKYTNPTGPGLDCITIKRDATPGEWMTTTCNTPHLYICQKSNATERVTAPLFTPAPSTTPRRTPLPPLPKTSIRSQPSSTLHPLQPPKSSTANQTSSSPNTAAIIGGAVAGGVGLIVIVVVITVIVCICQRNRGKTGDTEKTDVKPGDAEVQAPPPTYFFGIETTPKYRNEKPSYPSLPDFGGDKTAKGSTVGRNRSLRNSTSKNPDVIPIYPNLTLTPMDESTNYAKQYSADIFVNPELSY